MLAGQLLGRITRLEVLGAHGASVGACLRLADGDGGQGCHHCLGSWRARRSSTGWRRLCQQRGQPASNTSPSCSVLYIPVTCHDQRCAHSSNLLLNSLCTTGSPGLCDQQAWWTLVNWVQRTTAGAASATHKQLHPHPQTSQLELPLHQPSSVPSGRGAAVIPYSMPPAKGDGGPPFSLQ